MPGMGEEGRIRAAIGLGVSPEDIVAGSIPIDSLRSLRRAHVQARLRRGVARRGRPRPVAERPDYPDVEAPMPPIPGGEGLAAALAAVDTISVRVDSGMRNFSLLGAHVIETLAKANASTGDHPPRPTGHIPGTGPGPNVATGELKTSITVGDPEQTGFGGLEWSTDVGPAIVYGRAIELGMYRPPMGYHAAHAGNRFGQTASRRDIERRHPGFGGIYPYLRTARDEFEAQAEGLLYDEMAKALSD